MIEKRVGLFFGSFSPFHNGHLTVAKKFHRQFSLDEVRIIFTPQSPFKLKKKNTSVYLSSLQKLCQKISFLKLDLTETKMKAPHYSFLTIAKIKQKIHLKTKFFFLVGADNFLTFHQWKNFQFLLKNTHLVCYPRNSFSKQQYNIQKQNLITKVKNSLEIYFLNAPKIHISATEIRKKIKLKKTIKKNVPAIVYYDLKNKLTNKI